MLVTGTAALAQSDSTAPEQHSQDMTVSGAPDKRVINFVRGEIAFAHQASIPATGWRERKVPSIWLSDEARSQQGDILSAWLRVRFDRPDIGSAPSVIYTENNRERLTVFLNGVELFRNYRSSTSPTLGWNRPYIVPVPQSLLRDTNNELVLKVESNRQFSLGFGSIKVGSQDILGELYSSQFFWRISGVAAANYAMLFLTIAVFLMWLGRPKEHQLLWLCATGIAWFIRDLHFFVEEAPINAFLFQQLSYYSLFFAVALTLCFCAVFLNIRHRNTIIVAMLSTGLVISLFRIFVEQSNRTDLLTALATLVMAICFTAILLVHLKRSRSLESLILTVTITATTLAAVHDVGRMPHVTWWDGIGFHIQPYTGFLLFCVFLLSLGRRFIQALGAIENMNQQLEERINAATLALARSEQARRDLAVENAVGIERERLMREMHDGIGSNLVTALAIARNNSDPATTVATLERAITDLKLTVDSLAPVDGDVVALLANLRHRLESELARAGLSTIWQVESCPPLLWLDASSALQLLRIVQEGVSNTLIHANASVITIGCKAMPLEGKPGIQVSVGDDGCGFDPTNHSAIGHGLANMRARARALSAKLDVNTEPAKGVQFTLWLPLEKGSLSKENSSS